MYHLKKRNGGTFSQKRLNRMKRQGKRRRKNVANVNIEHVTFYIRICKLMTTIKMRMWTKHSEWGVWNILVNGCTLDHLYKSCGWVYVISHTVMNHWELNQIFIYISNANGLVCFWAISDGFHSWFSAALKYCRT